MSKAPPGMSPSKLIDREIIILKDWRGKLLADLRKVIHQADPKVTEEWKWGSSAWSHDGILLIANGFKDKFKVTFYQGAHLPDPKKVFNAGLEGANWRSIDFREGDKINGPALKNIVRAAVAYNISKNKK